MSKKAPKRARKRAPPIHPTLDEVIGTRDEVFDTLVDADEADTEVMPVRQSVQEPSPAGGESSSYKAGKSR